MDNTINFKEKSMNIYSILCILSFLLGVALTWNFAVTKVGLDIRDGFIEYDKKTYIITEVQK